MKNIKEETSNNLNKFYAFIKSEELLYYKNIYKNILEENSNLNLKKIKNYKKIVVEIANNIKQIALPDNSISYSYLLFLFLYNGYLTKNKKKSKNKNPKDVIGYLGMDVMQGNIYCRHAASIHEDVMNEIGSIGSLITTTTNSNINEEFSKTANHTINIIKYKNIYYANDILNGIFYYFVTPVILKSYNSSVPIEFQYQMYEPIEDIKILGKSEIDILNMINSVTESNAEEYLTKQELDEIISATKVRFYGSIKELEKYKRKTKILFWKISSKLF